VIVLDTTILAYAVGAEHPLREPSRRIVRAVQAGELHAQTTTFVIQEFLHVSSRRRDRAEAARLAREYAMALAPLLPHEDAHVAAAIELYEQHEQLGAFDAFLAAAALAAGATLVSADRAFADIPELRWVDPGSAELDALLGG
jgi:uncharacterized protein